MKWQSQDSRTYLTLELISLIYHLTFQRDRQQESRMGAGKGLQTEESIQVGIPMQGTGEQGQLPGVLL